MEKELIEALKETIKIQAKLISKLEEQIENLKNYNLYIPSQPAHPLVPPITIPGIYPNNPNAPYYQQPLNPLQPFIVTCDDNTTVTSVSHPPLYTSGQWSSTNTSNTPILDTFSGLKSQNQASDTAVAHNLLKTAF
jgi:hypothetical protein